MRLPSGYFPREMPAGEPLYQERIPIEGYERLRHDTQFDCPPEMPFWFAIARIETGYHGDSSYVVATNGPAWLAKRYGPGS